MLPNVIFDFLVLFSVDCSEISNLVNGRPLNGDIDQTVRESTLSAFKSGRFNTLVATEVAARGLDINDVGYFLSPMCAL